MQQHQGGPPMPGQMPTPEQIAAFQRQIAIDAEKAGMSVPEFIEHIKAQQMAARQAYMQQQMQQQQQGGHGHGHDHSHAHGDHGHDHDHDHDHDHGHGHDHDHGQGQPHMQQVHPGQPPNPVGIAMANFLRSQPLKPRTCILDGDRKDMFRVKRAIRALQTPAYEKARKKNPALPEVTDRASLENAFKLLPLSMLALRVTKIDPHEGHDHAPAKKTKKTKGLWTVRIEPQQEADDDCYYVWLYEGTQVMRKVYAALALVAIFAVVLYPLWPLKLRQGVYYLSWGFLGLLGLFFAMAIFRVILFCITYFAVPPGLWLYPNLWEDVSFMDSFRPVWAWHDPNPKKKKKSKSAKGSSSAAAAFAEKSGQPLPATATTTATNTQIATAMPTQRATYTAPQVEEVDE